MIKESQTAEQGVKNTRKIKNDIIFIAAVVLVIGLAAGAMFLFKEEGASVEVMVDGEIYGVYSLNINRTVEIKTGENGEFYNILVIENGQAYVKDANCPGVISYLKCTNQKPISATGESIICREHKIVISIKSEEAAQVPDIIS